MLDAQNVYSILIWFVAYVIGLALGYLAGRKAGRILGARRVREEAVREGAAEWGSNKKGAPTIIWLTGTPSPADLDAAPELPADEALQDPDINESF